MKNKLTFIFLILIFSFGSAVVSAQEQAFKTKVFRVKFARGANSVEYGGSLRGRIEHIYLVNARAGQTMRVVLEVGANEFASIQIKDPKGLVAPSGDGTDAGENWSNKLKKTGDYRISVFPPDTAESSDKARYRLKIVIE